MNAQSQMNPYANLLAKFRSFGGIANNIEIRKGDYGYGLFSIDESKTTTLLVPEKLMIQLEWVDVDEHGKLLLKPICPLPAERKDFFLEFERNFSWGAGVRENILSFQQEFFELPDSIKRRLLEFGWRKEFFTKPSNKTAFEQFKRTRHFKRNEKSFLIPILELVNHSSRAKNDYLRHPNMGLKGKFKGEIFVSYNFNFNFDAIGIYQNMWILEPRNQTLSGTIDIKYSKYLFSIGNFIEDYNIVNNVRIPKIIKIGNQIHLSYLVLSKEKNGALKELFIKLMQHVGINLNISSPLFDYIVDINKKYYQSLLEELNKHSSRVIDDLKMVTNIQLSNL